MIYLINSHIYTGNYSTTRLHSLSSVRGSLKGVKKCAVHQKSQENVVLEVVGIPFACRAQIKQVL